MQIISDMSTFSFVLFIAVLGFANTFYLLALNGIDYKACSPPEFEGLTAEEHAALTQECTPFTG